MADRTKTTEHNDTGTNRQGTAPLAVVVMEPETSPDVVSQALAAIERMGLIATRIPGDLRAALTVTGRAEQCDPDRLRGLKGVNLVIPISEPFPLASRAAVPEGTVVDIDGIRVGGEELVVMAGPCSVENRDQCFSVAEQLVKSGARIFRGGAYKPRTSPYTFQGLGEPALEILAGVRNEFGLRIVTEALDTETIEMVATYADIVQIGSRNMQNFSLLKKAGRIGKPVLLKRGMAASIEEFLMAAEYILAEGNHRVILCERGVRTLSDQARNVLDLSAIPAIKQQSHLPIIADPSHGTGLRERVLPMSRAAIAAGADGLLVEVHPQPETALSDGPQAITPDDFHTLMTQLRRLAPTVDRTCA